MLSNLATGLKLSLILGFFKSCLIKLLHGDLWLLRSRLTASLVHCRLANLALIIYTPYLIFLSLGLAISAGESSSLIALLLVLYLIFL